MNKLAIIIALTLSGCTSMGIQHYSPPGADPARLARCQNLATTPDPAGATLVTGALAYGIPAIAIGGIPGLFAGVAAGAVVSFFVQRAIVDDCLREPLP